MIHDIDTANLSITLTDASPLAIAAKLNEIENDVVDALVSNSFGHQCDYLSLIEIKLREDSITLVPAEDDDGGNLDLAIQCFADVVIDYFGQAALDDALEADSARCGKCGCSDRIGTVCSLRCRRCGSVIVADTRLPGEEAFA